MRRDIWKRLIVTVGILLMCGVIGSYFYLSDYYKASEDAYQIMKEEEDEVNLVEKDNEYLAFVPEKPEVGIIFYPGAKVEYTAYTPLMKKLAENGILTIVVHMPGNIALLDEHAGERVKKEFSEVDTWYLGGHSLGGVVASMEVKHHKDEYKGLILCAAYATSDIRDCGLNVLSIYGDRDGVLSMKKYRLGKKNLPEDCMEYVIKGGCHAYFGDYGEQKGDGVPTISKEEQWNQTVEEVLVFLDM